MELVHPYEISPLPAEEGGGYLVTFPDLPSCIAAGETVDDALRTAEDALEAYIETVKEFGGKLPEIRGVGGRRAGVEK